MIEREDLPEELRDAVTDDQLRVLTPADAAEFHFRTSIRRNLVDLSAKQAIAFRDMVISFVILAVVVAASFYILWRLR